MVYVCVRDVMDVVFSVCIVVLYRKYECFVMQMLYGYVHHVALLNAAFCMTCNLLMLVEDARGYHIEEVYSRAGHMTAL